MTVNWTGQLPITRWPNASRTTGWSIGTTTQTILLTCTWNAIIFTYQTPLLVRCTRCESAQLWTVPTRKVRLLKPWSQARHSVRFYCLLFFLGYPWFWLMTVAQVPRLVDLSTTAYSVSMRWKLPNYQENRCPLTEMRIITAGSHIFFTV